MIWLKTCGVASTVLDKQWLTYVDEFGCSKLPDRWWPLAFLFGQKRWESTEWIENPEDSFFFACVIVDDHQYWRYQSLDRSCDIFLYFPSFGRKTRFWKKKSWSQTPFWPFLGAWSHYFGSEDRADRLPIISPINLPMFWAQLNTWTKLSAHPSIISSWCKLMIYPSEILYQSIIIYISCHSISMKFHESLELQWCRA